MLIGLSSSRRWVAVIGVATIVVLLLFLQSESGSSALETVKSQLPRPPSFGDSPPPPPESPPAEAPPPTENAENKDKKPDDALPPSPPPPPHPKYKEIVSAAGGYEPPPVRDPFPLLANSPASVLPPPIPEWNKPREGMYKEYGLSVPPPLLIGFSRSWPMLLQAVVSYITAGWPPEQIYVVENTGVQQANTRGQLTLQHPYYLNHTTLGRLGVKIIQTPVLLNFAQLQNFYLSLTYTHGWPYYFWSHMDVLALSYEEGITSGPNAGLTGPYDGSNGTYKTVYELCLQALQGTLLDDGLRWGLRFFAYDHLALVNPKAYEAIGGWDTFIPYYLTDCDLHDRLRMANWTIQDRTAGIITDVNTILEDLSTLYRVGDVSDPKFVDPNPPPPKEEEKKKEEKEEGEKKEGEAPKEKRQGQAGDKKDGKDEKPKQVSTGDPNLDKWQRLRDVADRMRDFKYAGPTRNTWQAAQKGGRGEPFYYPSDGIAEAIDVITEAGREVYRRKWGHRDCDLIAGAGLSLGDEWLVEKDW
ncbi:hypothetical protein SBRCBS47491_006572 [Sporothrix bragantina]|uniref:Glycosyl transferase family 8 protein n=1 Tax=Sporothrix bragantina TaxID=671064 RepID=A0ABP0C851_9PEZI